MTDRKPQIAYAPVINGRASLYNVRRTAQDARASIAKDWPSPQTEANAKGEPNG